MRNELSEKHFNNIGETWNYYEREGFGGIIITAANKRAYLQKYKEDFIDGSKHLVDEGQMTEEQLIENAEKFAREHVNFHKKMERAHAKGKMFFTWRGARERVATYEYLSRMQQFMTELEEKYKQEQEAQEQEIKVEEE